MAKRFRFFGYSDDLIHVEEIQFAPPGEKPKPPPKQKSTILALICQQEGMIFTPLLSRISGETLRFTVSMREPGVLPLL